MYTLVVWAHPRRESFSHAVCDTTVSALRRAGHEVDLIDLYGERYQPAMSESEWLAYRDFTIDTDAVTERHIEQVRRAEQLVFVYPTWWFGLPAALKGWIERTMVPGLAFTMDHDSGRIRGNLDAVRRIVGVTTYGSAPWYVRLIGDAGRRTLTRALRLCSPHPSRVRVTWLACHRLDSADADTRAAFLRRIDEVLGSTGSTGRAARRRAGLGRGAP